MEKKRIQNQTPLPSGIVRLAAVLAEIAHNETTSASTAESVYIIDVKDEREGEN